MSRNRRFGWRCGGEWAFGFAGRPQAIADMPALYGETFAISDKINRTGSIEEMQAAAHDFEPVDIGQLKHRDLNRYSDRNRPVAHIFECIAAARAGSGRARKWLDFEGYRWRPKADA